MAVYRLGQAWGESCTSPAYLNIKYNIRVKIELMAVEFRPRSSPIAKSIQPSCSCCLAKLRWAFKHLRLSLGPLNYPVEKLIRPSVNQRDPDPPF